MSAIDDLYSQIRDKYSTGEAESPVLNKIHIKDLVTFIMSKKGAIEKEFELLKKKNLEKPNKVFPLKMEGLAAILGGAKILYTWYIERDNYGND